MRSVRERPILAGFCVIPLLLFSCGGEEGGGETTQPTTAEPQQSATGSATDEGKPLDPALGTSTITGSVKFKGKKPLMRPTDMTGTVEKSTEITRGK